MKPLLILDAFCGEGIASRGLIKFGRVVGFDKEDKSKYYPGEFIKTDWEHVQEVIYLKKFDFLWGSPPCQRYSSSTPIHARNRHPDLVDSVRNLFQELKRPFCIENVPGSPLIVNLVLCGCMFKLPLSRVRWFETNFFCNQPLHRNHWKRDKVVRVCGHGRGGEGDRKKDWLHAMGVKDNNCTRAGLAQGVPVPYVEYIMNEFLLWRRSNLLNFKF